MDSGKIASRIAVGLGLLLIPLSRWFSNESNSSIPSITIGNQVWMSKNLNVVFFRNADSIPQAKTLDEWVLAGVRHQPAWCFYDNDVKFGEVGMGRLYNWYAVNDPRGLAPEGWRIPKNHDWNVLINFLGGEFQAGYKMRSKEWEGHGSNESGFDCYPCGRRIWADEFLDFYNAGQASYFWTADSSDSLKSWSRTLDFESNKFSKEISNNIDGFSIRCIKNKKD
jgi:uncharacterized protein (TIGR02145 family)